MRLEQRKILANQFAATNTPAIEKWQLRHSKSRGDIAHVEFSAGKIDIAGAIGPLHDAVESQRFRALCFLLVRKHGGTTFDGGHVLVGVET